MKGGLMPDASRRIVTTDASLLATDASLMILRGVNAATHEAMREDHHMSEETRPCIQFCQDCHASDEEGQPVRELTCACNNASQNNAQRKTCTLHGDLPFPRTPPFYRRRRPVWIG